jgi:hypothetical protein
MSLETVLKLVGIFLGILARSLLPWLRKLFCLAFGFGFGWNALVLEGTQWAGSLAAPKSPKATNPEDPS